MSDIAGLIGENFVEYLSTQMTVAHLTSSRYGANPLYVVGWLFIDVEIGKKVLTRLHETARVRAPALPVEVEGVIERLLSRAKFARDENTGTALGDAMCFEDAASALQGLVTERDAIRENYAPKSQTLDGHLRALKQPTAIEERP